MANPSVERKTFGYYLLMVLIVFAVILYILPIYWIVVTSLKSPGDINTIVPKFFFSISLENYQKLLPEENVPSVTYLFIAQTLGGLFLFALFSLVKSIMSRAVLIRNIGLICNIIFILTCIYSFFNTQPLVSRSQVDVRFHFFTLIFCNIVSLPPICSLEKEDLYSKQQFWCRSTC